MKVIIQLNREEEAKALPIILRHSPGMVMPGRNYVVGDETVSLLRNAGIQFVQLNDRSAQTCRPAGILLDRLGL
ncbi:MAG TPA: hypothetical protein VN281_18770 [Verrucomicrobiae bacterium]|jgi:hypothetical protein|nr:hypothetical protein [Verrucomicrobiae bacterium]